MVILSLVIAQIILPFVTKNAPQPKIGSMNFKEARIYILEHVIDYLNKHSPLKQAIDMEMLLKNIMIN